MNRFDRFQQLIEEPVPPPAPTPTTELVQPLEDLARALVASAPVGASVQRSGTDRRQHLVVWPLHRPAFRSTMVTVQFTNGRGVVVANPMFWFSTADELTGWLESFVQRPEFRATLDELRVQATAPVDARLERANGMATLAGVSPEQQEALDRLAEGEELELDLELNEGEPVPDAGALQRLNSAGLRFEIRNASVMGRRVHMRVVRVKSGGW